MTKGVHDMGGDAAGPVDRHEHTPTLTERRIDAVMQLLRQQPRAFWKTDENRRTLESLAPEVYEGHGYYARWTLGMRSLLIEKGVLTAAEIDAKLAEVRARFGKAAGTAEAAGRAGARGKAAAKAAARVAVSAKAARKAKTPAGTKAVKATPTKASATGGKAARASTAAAEATPAHKTERIARTSKAAATKARRK